MFDTVIFDLDGTLLDTLPDLHAATNYALSKSGFPSRTLDEVRRFVGNGILNLIKQAVPEGTDEADTMVVFECFKTYYGEHSNDMTKAYEGIYELVERLKADKIKLGVVSNKAQFAVSAIMKHYFGDSFGISYGEREGVARKPCPDGVFDAIKALGGKSVLYVGDSDVDYKTAQNAGLDYVMVTWGFRDEKELRAIGAKVFAYNTEDLYRIIKGE